MIAKAAGPLLHFLGYAFSLASCTVATIKTSLIEEMS